jgi:hypothetical protein
MKIVPVPDSAMPPDAERVTFEFGRPIPAAVVDHAAGPRQWITTIELEPGDLEAIQRDGGRFLIRFFNGFPLFILDTISEPCSSGSVVASSPSGRIAGTAVEGELGTTETQMEGPLLRPPTMSSVGETSRRAPASVVPTSRSG